MSASQTQTLHERIVDALAGAFDDAAAMANGLNTFGINWAKDDLSAQTGRKSFAVGIVAKADELDPRGKSEIKNVVISALRAKPGWKPLLNVASELGVEVPEHLRQSSEHVLRLVLEENRGDYKVSVFSGPDRGKTVGFNPAFENNIAQLGHILVDPQHSRRGSVLARGNKEFDKGLLKDLGDRVFDFLLPEGTIRDYYNQRLQAAFESDTFLQVMLDTTQVPSLAHIPWELAFDPDLMGHLCLGRVASLVRFVDAKVKPVPPKRGLRFFGFIAITDAEETGVKLDSVQADREQGFIKGILKDIAEDQRWSTVGTLSEVSRILESREKGEGFNVFHFIGHGGFDEDAKEGYLLFQSTKGPKRISAATLAARLVVPGYTPPLVVLNCCSGAMSAKGQRFSSFAESLVKSGIRAVIAMQFPVSEEAAQVFSASFYGEIVKGKPIQVALTAARQAIEEAYPEWVTPALFTSGTDFTLVEKGVGARSTSHDGLPTPAPPGGRAEDRGQTQ